MLGVHEQCLACWNLILFLCTGRIYEETYPLRECELDYKVEIHFLDLHDDDIFYETGDSRLELAMIMKLLQHQQPNLSWPVGSVHTGLNKFVYFSSLNILSLRHVSYSAEDEQVYSIMNNLSAAHILSNVIRYLHGSYLPIGPILSSCLHQMHDAPT